MSLQPPPRYAARPATPDESPLMRSILNAAQVMFAGDAWEDVEPHLRRAWRTILDPTPWEAVRGWMHASWLKQNPDAGAAANDNDSASNSDGPGSHVDGHPISYLPPPP